MRRKKYQIELIVLFSILIVTACSTARKNKIEDYRTTEEKFIDAHFPIIDFAQWKSGDSFICTGGEFGILFRPQYAVAQPQSDSSYIGKRFIYCSMDEQKGVDGLFRVNLLFDCEGETFIYETQKTKEDILKPGYEPLIPNLVSEKYVLRADSLLQNQQFYINSTLWNNADGSRFYGRKLMPITIERIEAGNYWLPYKFWFKDDMGASYYICLMLKSRASSGENLTFDRVLSFENPRSKYPEINDAHWALITQSRVIAGMTKQACKLSWGSPSDVATHVDQNTLREQWQYRDGGYLFFVNGLLTQYRR